VPASDHNGDERPSRLGYFAAIFVSALGHAAIFVVVFFVAPRFLQAPAAAPPAYTVKIVDNIPAGDLGTHLPKINQHRAQQEKAAAKPEEGKVKSEAPKNLIALNEPESKNALAVNAPTVVATETPTPTPEEATETPTPEETAQPRSLEPDIGATEEPTAEPTPTPEPTKHLKKHATPKPTPNKASHNRPKAESTVAKAEIASTPSVAQRMAKLREQLLKQHIEDLAKNPPDEEEGPDDSETPAKGPEGGGPVEASAPSDGKGYGVGAGEGSVGMLQDPEFLLYYKTVQDQIKKSWTFTGGSNDLTATVNFAIGPDGALHNLKIGTSSNDPAFDDSVLRAIRRAAPFPAPPDKFRDQFSSGINAVFQLGQLKS
jgi:TonB family protein